MNFLALATDYDGTLAHDGVVHDAAIAALRRLKASGRKLIMVTGRELDDLFNVFAHTALFDSIVAENGALLYNPATRESCALASPPPVALIERLKQKQIPLSIGKTIVATVEPHEHAVLDAIRELGLEWHVIFNKGSVMALPSTVNKATGLARVLKELNLTHEQIVAVGDAENDHAFMRASGRSVAVANALPAVKADCDLITIGARGEGVTQLIDHIIANDLADVPRRAAVHNPPKPSEPLAQSDS